MSELDHEMISKIHEAPVMNPNAKEAGFQPRELISNVANSLLLYKRVQGSLKRGKVTSPMGKMLIIFKYLFIHDLIPYQKELLMQLIPVNVRFIEFCLVLLQIRQYYYDTVLEQPTEIIKKLFPTFFLVASKFLGHGEVDLILRRLQLVKEAKSSRDPAIKIAKTFEVINKIIPLNLWNSNSKL